MDSANHFKVRSPDLGRTLFFETNTPSPVLCRLTRAQALNLAAWLLALADDPTGTEFCRLLEDVQR